MSRPLPQAPGRLANWTRATPLGALATRWARVCAERRGVLVIAATDAARIVELTRKRTGQLHAWDSACPPEAQRTGPFSDIKFGQRVEEAVPGRPCSRSRVSFT